MQHLKMRQLNYFKKIFHYRLFLPYATELYKL